MFPKGIVNDTQIIATVLSANWDSAELGFWGITWASLALMQTWMPFDGPVSWAKVALMEDGSFIYDPTFKEEEECKLNIIVAGTMDALTMVEAGWKEVSNEEVLKNELTEVKGEMGKLQGMIRSMQKSAIGEPDHDEPVRPKKPESDNPNDVFGRNWPMVRRK